MNNDLQFDFKVDKNAKKVFITREFDAPIELVWDAFTKPELLDQWVAPAPYKSKTKHMNFEVGGKRFYAMVGPEGQESWILQKYLSINPTSHFKLYNVFADENENVEPNGSEWDYHFSEKNGITTVNIIIYNESFERMERLLEGFRQGFTITLEQLERVLSALAKP
jgi:uncharacterized protein YndB with AHSA1/START domain